MNLGYISRKIGLGSPEQLEGHSSLEGLISAEVEKPISYVGKATKNADLGPWPEELTYSLPDRISRLREARKRNDKNDEKYERDSVEFQNEIQYIDEHILVKRKDIAHFAHNSQYLDAQVQLRLSYFWLNHFTVGEKDTTPELIGDYWNVTITGGMRGKFDDLLYFATVHPAMLTYLDNIFNIGLRSPKALECGSSAGTRNCVVGLNDNLARELLELHSVSPSVGYTETDIHNAAKVLAGWGNIFDKRNGWGRQPSDWREPWDNRQSEPGSKNVMGLDIPSGKKGLRKLTDFLARHEATVDFLSRKLLRHFVGLDYSEADYEQVRNTWISTDGHLPSVHKVVLKIAVERQLPSVVWPTTWCFMVLRGLNADIVRGYSEIHGNNMSGYEDSPEWLLSEMGSSFWSRRQPNGFSDDPKDWLSTELLARKIRFAGLAYDRGRNRRTADEFIARMGFSASLNEKLITITNDRSRFIAAACSPEMMEV